MDILTLQQLIEKCQQLKTTSEFERQTHHRIYAEFIKPFLHALSWEESDLSLLELGHFLQLTLKPDVLTLFILGGGFDRRYETTVRTARLETGISAVTNFDKLIVHFRDDSGVKEIENFSSAGYLSNLNALERLFSKESIESGDYFHYITDKLKADFDTEFFDLLLSFRKEIAEGIWAEASNRAMLKEAYGDKLEIELNRLVQTIVDRFLIYRFAEDKMLLPQSRSIKQQQIEYESGILPSIWKGILYNFDLFRGRYNGKIFDEGMADRITLQNDFLINFVKKLYDVGFSEHRIEVLGHIYEKYLGEKVYIEGDNIRLDKTPEARKAGGVYYTPSYITKYIVDNTLGAMLGELEDKLEKIEKSGEIDALTEILAQATDIKILDPACGSGAFLIQALKLLRDFYETYSEVAEEIRKKQPADNLIDSGELTNKIDPIVYGDGTKSVRLSKAPGYYALQNNIYGVDIDERAVEVTAVSLMMQILDEVKDAPGLKFPAIMEENIKCGNSLISGVTDRDELEEYFREEIGELISLRKQYTSETNSEKKADLFLQIDHKKRPINLKLNSNLSKYFDDVNTKKPFNWEIEFPEVFFNEDGNLKGNLGFDCVVGNPPYGAYLDKSERKYLEKLESCRQNKNTAALFMELSKLLAQQGSYCSLIVPKSLIFSQNWEAIRNSILSGLVKLTDASKAWDEVLLEQVVFVYQNRISTQIYTAAFFDNSTEFVLGNVDKNFCIEIQTLLANIENSALDIYANVQNKCIRLGDISQTCRGMPWQSKLIDEGKIPFLGGANIYCYGQQGYKGFLDNVDVNQTKVSFLMSPKIVSQRIVAHITQPKDHIKIMSTFDNDGVLTVDTVENTLLIGNDYSYKFILAILNSTFVSWFAYRFVYGKAIRSMDFDGYYVNKILIPKIDFTNPAEKSQHDELAALADKMLHLNKRLHNELERLTFLQVCDLSAVPAQAGEINSNRLPLKEMRDRFRIAITGSTRKRKLTEEILHAFEGESGGLRFKDKRYTVRVQADEAAISFLRTYFAHIDAETLDTLNTEYTKLDDKIRNLPVPDLTIKEMSQALSRWEEIGKEKESLAEEIQDTDNLIDAKVFRLYGLERDEIVTVLDSLETDEEIKEDILQKWKREISD